MDCYVDTPGLVGMADHLLADPAFRAALVASIAEALDVLNLAEGRGEAPETAARIVARVFAG